MLVYFSVLKCGGAFLCLCFSCCCCFNRQITVWQKVHCLQQERKSANGTKTEHRRFKLTVVFVFNLSVNCSSQCKPSHSLETALHCWWGTRRVWISVAQLERVWRVGVSLVSAPTSELHLHRGNRFLTAAGEQHHTRCVRNIITIDCDILFLLMCLLFWRMNTHPTSLPTREGWRSPCQWLWKTAHFSITGLTSNNINTDEYVCVVLSCVAQAASEFNH